MKPRAGWREMPVFWFYDTGSGTYCSILASLTNPRVAWSVDGECEHVEMREPVAQCRPRPMPVSLQEPHESPAEDCVCGFAAYLAPEDMPHDLITVNPEPYFCEVKSLELRGGFYWPPATPDGGILALVWAWGTVYVHETNYRSQYMSIAALVDCGGWKTEVARRHAARLGVPLLNLDDAKRFAAKAEEGEK